MGKTKQEWFELIRKGDAAAVAKFMDAPKPADGKRSLMGTLKTLKKKSFDPNAKDEATGQYGIHVAAKHGHVAVIDFLVENGAMVDEANAQGETALHVALANLKVAAAKVLVTSGAHTESRGRDDKTPLHYAAEAGLEEAVAPLLAKGANIDAATSDGSTALHLAAMAGQSEVVICLLKAGADKTIKDGHGKLARELLLHSDDRTLGAFSPEAKRNKQRLAELEAEKCKPRKTYYELLGVDKETEAKKVKLAYRKMAVKLHPDKNPDDPAAQDKFNAINKAWNVLSDSELKVCYDKHCDTDARAAEDAVEAMVQERLRKGHDNVDQEDINDMFKDMASNLVVDDEVTAAPVVESDLDRLDRELREAKEKHAEQDKADAARRAEEAAAAPAGAAAAAAAGPEMSAEEVAQKLLSEGAALNAAMSMDELDSFMDGFGDESAHADPTDTGVIRSVSVSSSRSDRSSNSAAVAPPKSAAAAPPTVAAVPEAAPPEEEASLDEVLNPNLKKSGLEMSVEDLDNLFQDVAGFDDIA